MTYLPAHRPPPRREPIFNMPGVVSASVLILLAIHLIRTLVLSEEGDLGLLLDFALIPARWTLELDPTGVPDLLRDATGPEGSARAALARYLVAEADPKWWTALSYGALHGSWAHVGLNSVWLAAFGTPVARRCGTGRFLALLGLGTIAGGVAHAFLNPTSVSPLIGASAGISALTAAAARFVFAPTYGRFWNRPDLAGPGPAQSIPELLRNRSAALFLAIWFATNLLFGLLSPPLGVVDASVAWEAHIGGFLAGFLLFPWFDPHPRVPADA